MDISEANTNNYYISELRSLSICQGSASASFPQPKIIGVGWEVMSSSNTCLLKAEQSMRKGSQLERAADGSRLSHCPTFMESHCEEMLGR